MVLNWYYIFYVLVNLFGTVERVALGMGRMPEQLREVGETLAFLGSLFEPFSVS